MALLAGPAAAQVPARSGVPTPGKGVATTVDSDAIATNPAGLPGLPATELRALWAGSAKRSDRGLSLAAATPLIFDFSGGLRADFVRPHRGADHTWISSALGYGLGERTSLGLTAARSFSSTPGYDGHWGLTAGVLWRPWAPLGFGAVARNFNGGSSNGLALTRSYEVGLVLRPLGRRSLELGLDALNLESEDATSPRATLGIALPGIGRLRTEMVLERSRGEPRSLTASLGLDLGLGPLELSGGGLAGGSDRSGYYGGLALRNYRTEGVRGARHYVKMRLESTPGDRGHARLLRSLWRAAEASEIGGVVLHLKAEPASSMAHAEELGDALRMIRSRGKKVLCHLEDAGGRALHVCSQADKVFVNPAGGVRFSGLKTQYFYLGGLLEKLGVRAEFVRVAEHKTAPEQFTERGPTPTAAADHLETLRESEKIFLHDVGGGRKISLPELRDRLARGPFTAHEARAAGLVDGFAYDDELDAAVAEVEGERTPVVSLEASPALAPRPAEIMGSRDRVAVVYIDGDMVDGRSRSVPLVGTRLVGSYTVVAALRQARQDSRVRAVVLRLETPGGSSLAADVIWREVALTAKVKPVIASMGSTAASAGYYVASAATRIFASRSTITGSIGIYYGKADVDGLLQKLGVSVVTYRTSPHADAESLYRPFTDDERRELGAKVKQFYDTFVDRVSRGRHLTPAEVDAVARGKVWTGEQALERRLVDQLGGLREALAEARRLTGLPSDSPTVELPAVPFDLLGTALEIAGVAQAAEPTPLPAAATRILRQLAPFSIYDADTPLARLESVPELP